MVTRRQFDVVRNPNRTSAKEVPLLLCVQHPVLDRLPTCVVVPLVPADALGRSLNRLNPVFTIERRRYAMLTQQLGAVRTLGEKVSSLERHAAEIVAALDVLFSGV